MLQSAQNSRSASAAVLDRQVAEVEQAHGLVDRLQCVVIALQVVFLGEVAVDAEQVGDRLRRIFGDLRRRLVLVEVGDAEHVEDEHAVVGDHRPARLGEDRRVRDLGLVADVLDAEDDVVGVFLKRVVDRRHEVGLRAVVVDAQAAADVEVLDPGPDAEHLHVDPGRLGQGRLDVADVGDLAADVEVHELKAIGHVALLEVLEGFEDLGQGQAELGSKAGARLPPARAAGRELDPHADRRPDVQLLAVADDRLELGELLDDRDHLLADLAGEHGHLDELVVLEAVADDGRIWRFGQGEHGQQLGLRAGLEPEMVRLAKVEDLLDDMPLLVDLDRVDAAIAALVVVLADGGAEGVVDLADAMAEDVREAKQDRQLDAALLELIDQFLEVDRLAGVFVGMNRHVPLGIDPEIVLAPVADAVRFQSIIDFPRIGESMFRALRHSRDPPFFR